VVASVSGFSKEIIEAFQTLSSEVSLALESVALAEDLHRRRSEARLGSLVQNATDIMAVLEESDVVRYVSPAVEWIMGYVPEAVTGRSIFEFLHQGDIERVKSVLAEGIESPSVGPRIEFRCRRPDGSWSFLEASANNCMQNPDVRGFMLNCRDVTERRALLPARFISLAEETGLIIVLGYWVLKEACRQASEWQSLRASDGESPLFVSVKFSVRQLRSPDLAEEVAVVLRETGLEPDALVLEITESVAMEDVTSMVSVMRQLKSLGLRLAIDDFGTGYTSLSYLKRFPIDYLKIDRSFAGEIDEDAGDRVTLGVIIDIAHALSLEVLTEGIEDAGQLARLQELGCDLVQGHRFSEPVTPEVAKKMLKSAPNLQRKPEDHEKPAQLGRRFGLSGVSWRLSSPDAACCCATAQRR
jgi:PAS domain S-box-containing protein